MSDLQVDYIKQGDSLELMRELSDECVDLIFVDPPYWMRTNGVLKRVEGSEYNGCDDAWDNQFKDKEEYIQFTRNWLSQCKRILKPNGSIWVMGSMQCVYTIGAIMQALDFWFINDVIWHKSNPTPNFMGTRLNNSHETLIWATKSPDSKYTFNYKTAKEFNTDAVNEEEFESGVRKQLGSIWKMQLCRGKERIKNDLGEKLHSTQKPEELLRRIIAISSSIGDLVFDPFGGTMTSSVVAKKMGRHYISFEKEKEYCMHGQKRLDKTIPEIGDIEKAIFDKEETKLDNKNIKKEIISHKKAGLW